ncbi:MAG: hypothetical protein D6740_04400 [Alphaproteobacteria bacterium]|nr:MAG: hypothetical protein D6740_04400 [Alphaproteobacteria bacterium]
MKRLMWWRILAFGLWNTGILMRLYHHGDWNLPALFQLGDFFGCVLGSYIILSTRDPYRIEALMLAGLLALVTGIPVLLPRTAVSDFLSLAGVTIMLLGLLAIYFYILRQKRTFIIRDMGS